MKFSIQRCEGTRWPAERTHFPGNQRFKTILPKGYCVSVGFQQKVEAKLLSTLNGLWDIKP